MATTYLQGGGESETAGSASPGAAGADSDIWRLIDISVALQKLLQGAVTELKIRYGLSERGLHVLGLVQSGCDRPGLIADYLAVLPSTITLDLKRLGDAGLIRRRTHARDRRGAVLEMTEAGMATYHETVAAVRAAVAPLVARVSAEQMAQILGGLEVVVAEFLPSGLQSGASASEPPPRGADPSALEG